MIWIHKSFYPKLEGDSLSLSFYVLEAVIFLFFFKKSTLVLNCANYECMDKMAFNICLRPDCDLPDFFVKNNCISCVQYCAGLNVMIFYCNSIFQYSRAEIDPNAGQCIFLF